MEQPSHGRWNTAQEKRELAETVVGYLKEHPGGMDTLEGIAEWWVPRQKIRVDVEKLADALEELIQQGALERVGPENNPHYRLKGGQR